VIINPNANNFSILWACKETDIKRVLFWIYCNVEMSVIGVENYGDEKVVCRMCRKPILGPAFKYEVRNLFFHFSCLNEPTHYKALILHFISCHDRLMITEEVKMMARRRRMLSTSGAKSQYWVSNTNAPPPPNATCS
jgi:hypothetical protein